MDRPAAIGDGVDYNLLTEAEFRALVRAFLEQEYPPELRNLPRRKHWDALRPWYMALSRKGWLAPAWPREYGGMGLDVAKQLIMSEEYGRHGVCRIPELGVLLLGPLLIRFGSESQKANFLPKILSGEHIWCQGYSEPNAGSDLASLRTEALLDGDSWIVNGQKIWTSWALDANWIFLLARTNKQAKKQEGISFLMFPMSTPGITIKPIVNIDMGDDFCEVFFDNVKVPAHNLIGARDRGWHMAKALLGFERVLLASPKLSDDAMEQLERLATTLNAFSDPVLSDRYVRLKLDLEDHTIYYRGFYEKLKRGEAIGPEISILKLHQTELFQRITDLAVEIGGELAGFLEPFPADASYHPGGSYLQSRAASIYAGTSEIQRNIIAKNILQLPS